MIPDMSKLEPLDGKNYKRWAVRMRFYLEQIEIAYVLDDVVEPDDETELHAFELKFAKDDRTCKGMLLHHMSNTLLDIYMGFNHARDIWDALEKKYGTDDAGTKRYCVSKWLAFQVQDDKPIIDQIHAYENICIAMAAEGLSICDITLAIVLIEKLPPSWKDFRNQLMHKKKDLTLEELVGHLKIEEENRIKDKGQSVFSGSAKANLVEPKPHAYSEKFKGKGSPFKPQGKPMKYKFKGKCFECGKTGHKSVDCRSKKKSDQNQANLAEANEVSNPNHFVAVVSEANLTGNVAEWIVDTGATRHICTNKDMFTTYEKTDGENVFMGNSASATVQGKGKIVLTLTSGKLITLTNVLHVPEMRRNLISGSLLMKAGLKLSFDSDRLVITHNGEFVGKGFCNGGLFTLDVKLEIMNKNASTSSVYIAESIDLWHARLGHLNIASIKRLKQLNLIPSFSKTDFAKCEVCVEAKFAKKPFKSIDRQTKVLELVHSDLGDFKNYESRGGKRYYITFVDDCSRFTMVYLLRSKDEAEEMFLKYKAEVENQLDRKIKRLRSDRGGEYDPNTLKAFCEQNGIIHETTAPYTPEQNGIAERKNRTLKNMMNSMLISSGFSDNMWGEAILSACHVLNRVPHKKLDKTPYEIWKGRAPNLSYLKVWGCLAKVAIPSFKRDKIGPKTVDCIFIGYAYQSAAYRFLVKGANNSYAGGNIIEARDAEFFETVFPLKISCINDVPSSSTSSSMPVVAPPTSDVNSELEPRRSKRARKETSYGDDFITAFLTEPYLIDDDFVYVFILEDDPRTYEEAMKSVDAVFWKEAIDSELQSILSNNTWELVDLPRGCKPITCKWIFRKKLKSTGSIDKYKARIVVRGFTQRHGIDYFDTYSPVTKIATIRTLIALACIHDLVVHQMDVKTVFLNGDLDEEIYMVQPEGFVVPGQENKVCKLVKSLYGLKQAPKQWHDKFDKTMTGNGFHVNEGDSCVYSKHDSDGCVIICLYVDDMLIFGTNLDRVNETKSFLSSKFEMKDMGEADVILGVKIKRTPNGICLSQAHYVEKLLKKFNSFDVDPVRTPYDPSIHLRKNNGDPVSQSEYAKIIGSVMFLMNYTRPDIAYSVSRLSRYTHNPSHEHWDALKRLLRYLKGTMDWSLHYSKFPGVLEGYCDANWVSGNDEINSTSGYVFTLGGGAVSWKSCKQSCTAMSTMESEFIALELAGHEAEWLRNVLADIPLWGKPAPSVALHCDSQAAIAVANNHAYNGKKRHIRLRHKAIKELLSSGVISLDYVKSEMNIADPLTKGLCRKLVLETSEGMGLKPVE
jgi:hypothetical protein